MATGTTRRVSDGTLVEWPDAVAAWARAGRPVLERVASRYNTYVTYQQLSEEVQREAGITTGVPFRHWIGQVLGHLASTQPLSEPLLTSLVVRADGTIGDGYAIPIRARGEVVPEDLEMHAANERLRCYKYFGAVLPPDGGRANLTQEVAKRRRVRRRQSSRLDRATCPTCFLQLPASGICDGCGEESES
jgi:hypothetical protein